MSERTAGGGLARWRMLALLCAIRTAIALQFQAVGALSPLFVEAYGVGLADICFLIGVYLAPGIAFALPGAPWAHGSANGLSCSLVSCL